MEQDYSEHPGDFYRMDFETYRDFIVSYIERLRQDIIIERFAAEVPPNYLAVSGWKNMRYDAALKAIERELERRDTWQGKQFQK